MSDMSNKYKKDESCPNCGSENVDYSWRDGLIHCWICNHKWKPRIIEHKGDVG